MIVLTNAQSMHRYVVVDNSIRIGDALVSLWIVHMATSLHHTCYFRMGSTWHYYDDMQARLIDSIGAV